MGTKRKNRLVYILSASHSGSTLLAMLLGSHPEICTVGELKATSLGDTETYICSCRKKIIHCPFWSGVSRDMSERGFAFEITKAATDIRSGASSYDLRLLNPLHRGPFLEMLRDTALAFSPSWRRNLKIIQARNAHLIACLLDRTRANVIVDSSKIGIRLKYLLRNPFLDVSIIRLIRDGRSVALTYMDPARFADARNPDFRGGGSGRDRSAEQLGIEKAAHEWRRCNEEAELLLKTVDHSRWMEVRYESLCTSFDKLLPALFSFIGVDPGKATLDFRSREHHILGNGMRLDDTNEIRLDERWKSELNASHLKTFNSIAGEMNHKLGYL